MLGTFGVCYQRSIVKKKEKYLLISTIGISLLLTSLIPAIQWFVAGAGVTSSYSEVVSSILIIAGLYIWYLKTKSFSFLPSSESWKKFCILGSMSALILLLLDITNEPISKITGQARCSLSVVNVIVLSALAEELIFRGHMWSLFEKVTVKNRLATTLLVTSFLFGAQHIGYWLQFYRPLPIDAIFHSLLMILSGFFLGLFRWLSGSLWGSIVVHIVANGIVLLFQ
jgi:membrane protease YdiL (CAAX protease family)